MEPVRDTYSTSPGRRQGLPFQKKDLIAIGLIFSYFFLFALLRLFISPAMELDEAEQFLNGATFQWGYREQAPLYSWIVKAVSVVSGLHALTLVMIKYSLLFLFYGVFYRIARSFWTPGRSLIVTASLTLFPVYPSRRGV